MVNMSSSNNSTPRSTIDDFREIIREQSFIIPNNSSSTSSSSDHVPVKKYPPLPDITVPNTTSINNTFFRTEAVLITPKTTNQPKKQMFYHFAPTQRQHLPALNKRHVLPTMSNVMDLDEDLPQCNTTIVHRAATYTSPGDRVVSPIKRPSAPSPPASAHPRRVGQNAFINGGENQSENNDVEEENYSGLEDGDDDDDSQSFDENYYGYNQQPRTMMNRRMDHYSHSNRYINMNDRQNTILTTSDYDEPAHPIASSNFQP
ncbi:unnamed protein product [Adineta steineri]|uniref:Uncharacterized protein n=1 Tax=Adineta steineri TaxID=433720 RepID=A0A814BF82_9BILA|nr:unnamed protein product [Adineta steineri]CAF0991486.1 unnamed protein product [Adineta steineri]